MTQEEIRAVARQIWLMQSNEIMNAVMLGAGQRTILQMADADSMTPEGMVQRTIDNLTKGGILSSKTVEQVKTAADKASSDVAVNRAFGRR